MPLPTRTTAATKHRAVMSPTVAGGSVPRLHQPHVEQIDRHDVDRHRYRHRQARCRPRRASSGARRSRPRRAGPRRWPRSPRTRQEVQIAEPEGQLATGVQQLRLRHDEVHPPHAERQPGAGDRDEDRGHAPALCRDDRRQRGDRADDALAERDDGQQRIALGDVVGVPRRAAHAPLGQPRPEHLEGHQHRADRERRRQPRC